MYDTIGLIIKAENEIDVMENAKVLMDERTRLDPGEDSEKWDFIICEWYSFFKEEYDKLQTYARINSKRGISILSDLLDKGDPRDYKNLEEIFKDISDRPKGNQIIGEVINYSNDMQQEEKTINDLEKEEDRKNLLTSKIETDMVVEGYLEIPFTILEN